MTGRDATDAEMDRDEIVTFTARPTDLTDTRFFFEEKGEATEPSCRRR
jgi:hypothetical protein